MKTAIKLISIIMFIGIVMTTIANAQSPNYVAKYNSLSIPNLNSLIFDNGVNLGVNNPLPTVLLDIHPLVMNSAYGIDDQTVLQTGFHDPTSILCGASAGWGNSGIGNSFMGSMAGFNTSGSLNSFMGYLSAYNNTSGTLNCFYGNSSGYSNYTGAGNVYIGSYCAQQSISGDSNVYAHQTPTSNVIKLRS